MLIYDIYYVDRPKKVPHPIKAPEGFTVRSLEPRTLDIFLQLFLGDYRMNALHITYKLAFLQVKTLNALVNIENPLSIATKNM